RRRSGSGGRSPPPAPPRAAGPPPRRRLDRRARADHRGEGLEEEEGFLGKLVAEFARVRRVVAAHADDLRGLDRREKPELVEATDSQTIRTRRPERCPALRERSRRRRLILIRTRRFQERESRRSVLRGSRARMPRPFGV